MVFHKCLLRYPPGRRHRREEAPPAFLWEKCISIIAEGKFSDITIIKIIICPPDERLPGSYLFISLTKSPLRIRGISKILVYIGDRIFRSSIGAVQAVFSLLIYEHR